MVDFTVAIRTFNAGDRLPYVLNHLRAQVDVEAISWEVLIVDNNSSDDTAKIVQEYQKTWLESCPLRYVVELQQGAAFARRRAMQEAQGALVGFVDDDTLPAPNWVAAAHAFGQAHPKAGAFGGQNHGQYEVPPPENFGRIACFLAVTERRHTFCYNAKTNGRRNTRMLPAGAGTVVRKQAWLDSVPEQPVVPGATGRSIASKGEDIETFTYLRRAGWEIWNNADMHVYHLIPSWRLERDYLLKVVRSVGLAKYRLRMLNYHSWQMPFATVAYFLNDLRKAIAYYVQHRQQLKTDVVTACEMELLASSLVSPLHYLKQRVQRLFLTSNPD